MRQGSNDPRPLGHGNRGRRQFPGPACARHQVLHGLNFLCMVCALGTIALPGNARISSQLTSRPVAVKGSRNRVSRAVCHKCRQVARSSNLSSGHRRRPAVNDSPQCSCRIRRPSPSLLDRASASGSRIGGPGYAARKLEHRSGRSISMNDQNRRAQQSLPIHEGDVVALDGSCGCRWLANATERHAG